MHIDIYYATLLENYDLNRPSEEKVFSYLKKLNKDCRYDSFNRNKDKLVKRNFLG